MKAVPQEIFPALAVNLVQRQKSPKFDFYRPETSEEPSQELLQYRNAIQSLYLDLGGAGLLVDAIYSLDIYYSGLSENCSAFRSVIYSLDIYYSFFFDTHWTYTSPFTLFSYKFRNEIFSSTV